MCVIAAKPKNTVIPRETLQRCFDGNPDGAGFVVARNNQIIASKGYFKFDDFYTAFQPYEKDVAVIHFRIKTHGNKNAEMCHPFEVLPNRLWVAHNGIIDISTKNDPSKSDTWHFVDLVLQPELNKDPAAVSRPSFQYLLGSTIGHSKLAFLNNRGAITIINKDKGEMDGDVWYSNGSYKAPRNRYPATAWNAAAAADDDYDTGVYYGGRTAKKHEGAGASSCAPCSSPSSNGAGSQTASTKKSTAYADLKELPTSYNWIVENLRDFGFEDDLILNEINADTAEDMALDLLVYEAGRPEDAPAMSREEIAEELMNSAAAEEEADEAAEALAAEADMTAPLDGENEEAAAIAANVMA